MKNTIYFYSGTGNSLWTAKKIAECLGETSLIPIKLANQEKLSVVPRSIGIIFPVHIWGLPPPVLDFISRLKTDPAQYIFAVAVNAGQVAATLVQLQKLLQTKHLQLSAGFSIDLPSNYIVWRGAVSQNKQQKKFADALKTFERIATTVRNKEKLPPEKGPFWQNPFFSWTYRKSFPHIGKMDKSFITDEKCNACGICKKICPAQNILMTGGKPVWQHRCEQCFACIQWCPEEAIQYGKNTQTKKRYHHPEITLKEMLACNAPQNR
ncbi:MAG: EFR1 family ferrodoxin [Smithellaceae bacterium]